VKSKILSYAGIFFLLVLLFNQVSQFFERVELKPLKYTKGEIDKFIVIGINSDRYSLKGDRLIDTEGSYLIRSFNLEYLKDGEKIYVRSEEGIYKKNKDILDLKRNVKIVSGEFVLETDSLRMLVKERRAFNSSRVKLYSDRMETFGDNLFMDIPEQSLKLENVRTVFRGN